MVVVKFFLRLDLEEKISFLDGHYLARQIVTDPKKHNYVQSEFRCYNESGAINENPQTNSKRKRHVSCLFRFFLSTKNSSFYYDLWARTCNRWKYQKVHKEGTSRLFRLTWEPDQAGPMDFEDRQMPTKGYLRRRQYGLYVRWNQHSFS